MALPRVPKFTPVTPSRSLADFPAYVASNEKLANIVEQRADAEREFREASSAPRETREQRIRSEAVTVLAGGDTAVATVPDLAELQRRRDILNEAVRLQESEVERERTAAAREISAEMLPPFRAAVAECLQMQNAAFAAYDKIGATAAATQQACNGPSLLPALAIDPRQLNQFRHFFGAFKSAAEEMLNLANEGR